MKEKTQPVITFEGDKTFMLFSQNSATKIIIRKQEEKLHSVMKVNIRIDISTEPIVNVYFVNFTLCQYHRSCVLCSHHKAKQKENQ